MAYTHLSLLLILGFLCYGSAKSKNCTTILRELADAQMNLVGCMVRNSSPAKSCTDCNTYHAHMTEKYALLILDAYCSKEILNQNRLDIVNNMQKSFVDVWNKGFCDDCFVNGTLSDETLKFVNLSKNFQNCIGDNKLKPCNLCNGKYADLNSFYKEMDEAKQGRICFDTQDEMNKTRSLWSKDLNCCHREYNLTFFIIASSLFAALPIAFYFGMYGYTKRMERNHEVLDANLNTGGHASTSTGTQPGTIANIEERTNQREDSSSDEDCIEKMSNKNSVHPKDIKTLKTNSSAKPTSSKEIGTLIEL